MLTDNKTIVTLIQNLKILFWNNLEQLEQLKKINFLWNFWEP